MMEAIPPDLRLSFKSDVAKETYTNHIALEIVVQLITILTQAITLLQNH